MSISGLGTTQSITTRQLHEIIQGGKEVEVIDVRTPAEYRSAHIPPARLVPLESLDPKAVIEDRTHPGEPLYVICRSGTRSEKACGAFAAAGYGNAVVNVVGGTLAWEQAGFPLIQGRFVLPLDRQVRIAIGILVLLGMGLGYWVNPAFYGLAAFCGAGLVFAGITDICPLAALIARMPWNQNPTKPQSCAR